MQSALSRLQAALSLPAQTRRLWLQAASGLLPWTGLLAHFGDKFGNLPPHRQMRVADRAGLANRTKEPAHAYACPHTAYRKRKPCCAKEKPRANGRGLCSAPLLHGSPNPRPCNCKGAASMPQRGSGSQATSPASRGFVVLYCISPEMGLKFISCESLPCPHCATSGRSTPRP